MLGPDDEERKFAMMNVRLSGNECLGGVQKVSDCTACEAEELKRG